MRVAFLVHQYLPDHVGGTELYTHGLARRAARAGHDVLVVTHAEAPTVALEDTLPRRRSFEGIPVVEVRHTLGAAPNILAFEYDNPVVGEEVRRTLAGWGPDVVHFTHAMRLTASSIRACRSLGIPIVLTLSDFWFLCPRHTLLTWKDELCSGPSRWRRCLACVRDLHGVTGTSAERRALRGRPDALREAALSADRVLALSPFLARTFVQNGYPPDRIEVIRHGIEHSGLESGPGRVDDGVTRFVMIGPLARFKGFHVVAEALARVPDLAPVEVTIYGRLTEDPYVDQLRSLAHLDARIRLAGTFEPRDLGRVLTAADYLAVPALWYENEPIVVKAAKHLGVPVIASGVGSLLDMLEPDVDGWFVPPGNVGAWAEALRRAVELRTAWDRTPRPQPDMDEHYGVVERIWYELGSEPRSRMARR